MERIPVYIMRGLPGSGKSTFAKRLQLILSDIGFNVIYLSRDELRQEIAEEKNTTYEQTFNGILSIEVFHKWSLKIYDAFNTINIPRKAIIVDTQFVEEMDIRNILQATCNLRENNYYPTYEDWIKSRKFKIRIVEFPEVIDNHRNVPDKKMKEFRHDFITYREVILSYLSEKNFLYVK